MDSHELISADELGTGGHSKHKQNAILSRRMTIFVFVCACIIIALSIALPLEYATSSSNSDLPPYIDGHVCATDDECISTYCTPSKICAHIANNDPCLRDEMCFSESCVDSVCGELSNGNACTYDQGCISSHCVNATCKGREPGDTCTAYGQCFNYHCPVGGVCLHSEVDDTCFKDADCVCGICNTTMQYCIARPSGAACSTSVYCCAHCIGDICRSLNGAACDDNAQCMSLTCSAGHCIPSS